MKYAGIEVIFIVFISAISLSFQKSNTANTYTDTYQFKIQDFIFEQKVLLNKIDHLNNSNPLLVESFKYEIFKTREHLKSVDFWLRYLEPLAYKKINAPLPVEWETEVFEKYEKPYRRDGAGLTLALLYLDNDQFNKDTLAGLIKSSIKASEIFLADSITRQLKTHHHFYLSNRLFLLNLASIYTTGYECPDTSRIILELKYMVSEIGALYAAYNESFPEYSISQEYLSLYQRTIGFVESQPDEFSLFDHFTFIRDFVNPLYAINQNFILKYKVISKSSLDYSINKLAASIFDKDLYKSQNTKGIFLRVNDKLVMEEIDRVGKLLFYDPILSGNNRRSCASCHHPSTYFTDTLQRTSLHFNRRDRLERNSPSLVNSDYNHLLMLDGKHFSLQNQAKDVITNPNEMGSKESEVIDKLMSCSEYKKSFNQLLKYTPQEKKVTLTHIVSAITYYYGKYSSKYSPFDNAMNNKSSLDQEVIEGFNIFMSKGQCATCHFVPKFNGVKPPFIGSEFEVLGVPMNKNFEEISRDKGRYNSNPAFETLNAFRTSSIRNTEFTKPFMHNGIFDSLEEVIDFYNVGGGKGHGLNIENQTLSGDSLKLSVNEKAKLIAFIKSLSEEINYEDGPLRLPLSRNKKNNYRKVGGEY